MKVHPIADLFPPLTEPELRDLADSIKTHGLQHPIVLDANGVLLDGRHRLAVCKALGVEPRFTTYEGDTPDTYALSVNIQQRNLTSGQAAMIAAKAHAHAATSGLQSPDDSTPYLSEETGGADRIALAQYVMQHEPSLVDPVVARAVSLDEAYKVTRQSVGRAQAELEHLTRLRVQNPELADRVISGELSPIQAWQEHAARAKEDKRQRMVATNLRCDVVPTLAQTRGSRAFARFDPQYQSPGCPVTRETITHAMTALTEMAAIWEQRDLP
ncbi:ParB N-terminal domain-containing protein [Streptomyces antarcticus]|uniref:ParB N-terminal domain-containing protein n=1 Tax=Streptomyces antarcticus TaxID=2996458 RepID=UPI002D1E49AF|nr:ParB N-terminal domain-containing protein [Streptomyces sp. H34-AA3]